MKKNSNKSIIRLIVLVWSVDVDKIYEVLEGVRKISPLVHRITNWITISDRTNIAAFRRAAENDARTRRSCIYSLYFNHHSDKYRTLNNSAVATTEKKGFLSS
jgi:hypothetical protein